jgi:hypothetical protein
MEALCRSTLLLHISAFVPSTEQSMIIFAGVEQISTVRVIGIDQRIITVVM